MKIHTFIKENYEWYISPEKDPDDSDHAELTILEGSPYLLDLVSGGKQEIKVCIDTEPLEKALACRLIEHADAPKGGGYYQLLCEKGNILKTKIWICDVLLYTLGDIPKCFYLKRIVHLN
jgi:hypothetical protein